MHSNWQMTMYMTIEVTHLFPHAQVLTNFGSRQAAEITSQHGMSGTVQAASHLLAQQAPAQQHRDDFHVQYEATAVSRSLSSSPSESNALQVAASEADIQTILTPELRAIAATVRVSQRSRLPTDAVKLMRAWLVLHDSSPYPDTCAKRVFATVTGTFCGLPCLSRRPRCTIDCARAGLTVDQVTTWFANQRKRHWFPKKRRALLDRGIAAGAGSGNAVAAAAAAVSLPSCPSGAVGAPSSRQLDAHLQHHMPVPGGLQHGRYFAGTAPPHYAGASTYQQGVPRIGFSHGALPSAQNAPTNHYPQQTPLQQSFSALDAMHSARGRYYSSAEALREGAMEARHLRGVVHGSPAHQQCSRHSISACSCMSGDFPPSERTGVGAGGHFGHAMHAASELASGPASQRTQSMPEEIGAKAHAWRGNATGPHATATAEHFASPFGAGVSAAGWLVFQRSRSVEAASGLQHTDGVKAPAVHMLSDDNLVGRRTTDEDGDADLHSPSMQHPYADSFPVGTTWSGGQWAAAPVAAESSVGSSTSKHQEPSASASSQVTPLLTPLYPRSAEATTQPLAPVGQLVRLSQSSALPSSALTSSSRPGTAKQGFLL